MAPRPLAPTKAVWIVALDSIGPSLEEPILVDPPPGFVRDRSLLWARRNACSKRPHEQLNSFISSHSEVSRPGQKEAEIHA